MRVIERELRIVFAGTAGFAAPSLDQLVRAGHEIALVVTQPDRLAGRGLRPVASPIKQLALRHNLPCFQPNSIKDDAAQARIRAAGADVMVVVAYGQILRASLLQSFPLGTVNVHASLLPRHRGPAPIEWAILRGDSETGVTIMQMDAGVDTGGILAQAVVPILPQETAAHLENRLADAGAGLLVITLDRMRGGRTEATAQSSEGITLAPRLKSEDGKLDPRRMTAVEIDRRVRALSERVGTWMPINGSELKIIRGHIDGTEADGIPVPTEDGLYVVDEVQPPGGKRMSAQAWRRGRR